MYWCSTRHFNATSINLKYILFLHQHTFTILLFGLSLGCSSAWWCMLHSRILNRVESSHWAILRSLSPQSKARLFQGPGSVTLIYSNIQSAVLVYPDDISAYVSPSAASLSYHFCWCIQFLLYMSCKSAVQSSVIHTIEESSLQHLNYTSFWRCCRYIRLDWHQFLHGNEIQCQRIVTHSKITGHSSSLTSSPKWNCRDW